MSKRIDYINWSQYFMGIAQLCEQRSKDPSTQVGACIVTDEMKIVGTGYNGFPTGISDDVFPWEKTGDYEKTKYPYVCHAEMNSIMNCVCQPKNCTMYVTLFPCTECAKLIIQSGIKRVVYLSDKYKDTDSVIASKLLLKHAGIHTKQYESQNKLITLTI